MSFTALIPARLGSSRLPRKPLLDIGGKPMFVRTAEQAARSDATQVIIATDDQEIAQLAQEHGFEAALTRSDHPSGTDRLAEAAHQLGLAPDHIVVNVQGDEPLIDPALINQVAQLLERTPHAAMATCASALRDIGRMQDPNTVKVVCAADHTALYFSRAPIPWPRDAWADGPAALPQGLPVLHHIGLYAYRCDFLQRFPQLEKGPLERFEALEQLRALENGYRIAVAHVSGHPAPGVDTLSDLQRVRELWANRL